MKKKREKIGKFVITTNENIGTNHLICNFCSKKIAKIEEDELIPNVEKLVKLKNVPIQNFGWFCSQECGNKYSEKYSIEFQKDENGKIEYY